MALNPNIALAVKGPEFADPLAMYGRVAAIQGAQAQNQLAQYQMAAAQRAEARDVARTNALAAAGTDEASIANALLRSGDIKGYTDFMKASAERKTALLNQQKTEGEILKGRLEQSRELLGTINPTDPDAPNQYLAWHEANHKDPIIGPMLTARGVTADQARARINQAIQQGPEAFAELLNQSKLGVEKFMTLNAPKVTSQDLSGSVRLIQTPGLGGPAKVVAGSTAEKTLSPEKAADLTKPVLTKQNNGTEEWLVATPATGGPAVEVPGSRVKISMTPYQAKQVENEAVRIKQEGQRIGLEGRRVAVAEEQLNLLKDPAFQQRMAAAKETGQALAKGDVAAVQALPKVLGNAQDAMNLIDMMVGKAPVKDNAGKVIQSGTAPHPGFEDAVGATWKPGFRFIDGTNAASFMALFNQTKGSAFLQAFEALKGGGAITEKEGEKGTAALTRMSTAQNEREFVQAAREYQDILRRGMDTIQKRTQGAATRMAPTTPGMPAAPGAAPTAIPSVSNW